jgi:hypothetical protein
VGGFRKSERAMLFGVFTNGKAPANDECLSSLFSFKNNIVETAQAFNLQYDRVGCLENVEG